LPGAAGEDIVQRVIATSSTPGAAPELTVSEALTRRRAARHYRPEPVPVGEILGILDQTRLTPSGYNLQPVHFVLVTDPGVKRRLRRACMGQQQVEEASAVVVFVSDLHPHRGRLDAILARDLEAGAIDPKYAEFSRRVVRLTFEGGPLGVWGLVKAGVLAAARLVRPMLTPMLTGCQRREWALRQAAMAGQTFLISAAARGLDTCPMEGFDPWRVRRVLGVPRRYLVALVVTVGKAVPHERPRRVRLPLQDLLHENRF
jgi:nitroreductase